MFVYNFATGDMQDYGGNQYRTRGLNGSATRIPYVGNKYLIAIPSRRAAIPGIDPHFSASPLESTKTVRPAATSAAIKSRYRVVEEPGGKLPLKHT